AIYLDVKQFLANQRQGTHKTKQRNEVKGSSRKLRKQKGSGAARVGSIRNPLFRGGGRVFGPQPRNYGFKLNKKLKQLARKSAFTYKAIENRIVVIDEVNFESIKTKNYINLINSLKLTNEKTLLVLPENNKNVYLSSRNLQKTKVTTANQVCTYDILNAGKLLLTADSVKKLEEAFAK